jgi:predicted phosphodiesterase
LKIQAFSDAHLERTDKEYFLRDFILKDLDILIIAGDLCPAASYSSTAKYLSKKAKHVIYVPGNHDYYRSNFEMVNSMFKIVKKNYNNFHILLNEVIEIEGLKFAGTTLWFKDDPLNIFYEKQLSDFGLIQEFKKYVYEENKKALNFLENLQNVDFVITHHLPSEMCVAEQYKGDPLNRFFVCEVSHLIKKISPKYWIFGHTHDSIVKKYLNTILFCNPIMNGRYDINLDFKKELLIL